MTQQDVSTGIKTIKVLGPNESTQFYSSAGRALNVGMGEKIDGLLTISEADAQGWRLIAVYAPKQWDAYFVEYE